MLNLLGNGNGLAEMSKTLVSGAQAMYGKLCEIAAYLAPQKAYTVFAGTTTSSVSSDLGFVAADTKILPYPSKRLDLTLFDNNAFVQLSNEPNASAWEQSFELIAPGFYSLPAYTRAVRIRGLTTAQARYSLIIWT